MALTKTDLKLIGKQTKDIVHEVLTDFYQNLFKVEFASKKDLQGFKQEMTGFKQEMTGFKQEMTSFKDQMVDFKDKSLAGQEKVLKELENMRDEHLVIHHRVYDKHEPELRRHDKRISTLEMAIL